MEKVEVMKILESVIFDLKDGNYAQEYFSPKTGQDFFKPKIIKTAEVLNMV